MSMQIINVEKVCSEHRLEQLHSINDRCSCLVADQGGHLISGSATAVYVDGPEEVVTTFFI